MPTPHKHTHTPQRTGVRRVFRPRRSVLLTFAFCFAIILWLGVQPRVGQAQNGVFASAQAVVTRSYETVRHLITNSSRPAKAATSLVAPAAAQPPATPGGVSTGLLTWLAADDVDADGNTGNNPGDGAAVTTWQDKSVSNNDALTLGGQQSGTFESDAASTVNSQPVVRFPGNAVYVFNGIDIRAITLPEITVFTVYKQGNATNTGLWGNDNGNWDRFIYTAFGGVNGIASQGTVLQGKTITNSGVPVNLYLFESAYASGTVNGSAFYINGQSLGAFTDSTDLSAATTTLRLGWDGDDGHMNGDIAEFILYNRKLTDCEIQSVNAYLADKYGVTLDVTAANYGWPDPYRNQIAGIGAVDNCGNLLTVNTATSNIVTINTPSSNDTAGEFLTFAHNGDVLTPSAEAPAPHNQRITREWRADKDGDVGTVSVCFNLSGLGYNLGTASNFALLRDTDGNFSDALVHTTGRSISGNSVCFTNVSFNHGDYFTLGLKIK